MSTTATIPADEGQQSANVKFVVNVPVTGQLKYDEGLPCTSKYTGEQVRYTFEDGRAMYVTPSMARKISELGIRRGVPFSICKRELQMGTRKVPQWEIVRLDTEAAPDQIPAAPASGVQTNGTQPQHSNGAPPAPAAAQEANMLVRTGKLTIDAILAVEAYAHEMGMGSFSFGAENIQKVWVSMLIDAQKRGGR